jgi:hypothetical protein
LRGNETGLRGPAGPRPGGIVNLHAGGGGGYGGRGGQGSVDTGGPGGDVEPGNSIPVLWGGSSGGGGGRGNDSGSSAGAGGGAMGVYAVGNINLTGATLTSRGGAGGDMIFDGVSRCGGGGSGGAFLFVGNAINVTGTTIDVQGGRGGDSYDDQGTTQPKRAGGGGGGGRIAFLYKSSFNESGASYVLDGGRGGYADGGGELRFGEDGEWGVAFSGEMNPATLYPNTVDSRLDPQSIPSLGTLTATGGTLSFNTDPDVRSVSLSGNPGGDFSLVGVRALSETGQTEMTAFTFDSITIGSGVTIQVQGNQPLALLSRSDLSLASNIDLSGSPGENENNMAPGVSGGFFGGQRGLQSTPALNGIGAGLYLDFHAGGGGAFGGNGGQGSPEGSIPGGAGGNAYGNKFLTELLGGSGGGGGGRPNASGSGGGAGGGSIQLAATNTLTIAPGTIVRTNGGQGGDRANYGVLRTGGGGAGGGILLSANEVVVTGAILEAKGGKGGDSTDIPGVPGDQTHPKRGGGGGGGGRIAIYSNVDVDAESATLNVAGGAGGIATHEGADPDPENPRERAPGEPGNEGTIYLSTAPVETSDHWSIF